MTVGIVAIGRDEGERLARCLAAARRECSEVVYVDSASRDGSVDIARALGIDVVVLDRSALSAARARNAGFRRLVERRSDVELVQFVDGDCELVPGWLASAVAHLEDHPEAAAVCGRRRERDARSPYHRLLEIEWDRPTGEVASFGGDALVRAEAFAAAGGFRAELAGGEEPELCARLRAAGWTIHRIAAEMTVHDGGTLDLGAWWDRKVRSGRGSADVEARHPGMYARRIRSIRLWTTVPPLAALALGALGPRRWRQRRWLAALPLTAYPAQLARVAQRHAAGGMRRADALLYAADVLLGKFPEHLGVLSRGRAGRQAAP
jgi:GT2 family glycosyltransferase